MTGCPRSGVVIFLVVTLLGCSRGGDRTAAPPPVPTLTVAPAFDYSDTARWTELTEESAEVADRGPARLALETKRQVGVVYLGEHVRIYNISGRWRPLTLTLLDKREQPRMTVRLDLPPSGVVRTALPQLADDNVAKLRFAEPSVTSDASGAKLELRDRRIGTPAAEFTTQSVAELGFAIVESHTSDDGGIEATPVGVDARGEVDVEALRSALGADKSARVTTTRTESGVTTFAFDKPTRSWESVVLADRYNSSASHGGDNGVPPPENWWVSTVGGAIGAISE